MSEPRSESKQVECRGCGLTVTLPPTPGRPGFVDIEPIDGWTAPPPLCPSCSKTKPILPGAHLPASDETHAPLGLVLRPSDVDRPPSHRLVPLVRHEGATMSRHIPLPPREVIAERLAQEVLDFGGVA